MAHGFSAATCRLILRIDGGGQTVVDFKRHPAQMSTECCVGLMTEKVIATIECLTEYRNAMKDEYAT